MAIDAAQLQTRGAYEAQVSLTALLDDLNRIRDLLDRIVSVRSEIRMFSAFAIVAAILSGVAAVVFMKSMLGFAALAGFITGILMLVYSFFYGSGLTNPRDRLEMMKGVARTLQPDVDPQSLFSVRLAIKSKPKLISEETWLARPSGKQKLYEREILSLEGKLLDGTVCSECVRELTRKRTFQNSRGKFKSKTRQRYVVTLRFAYPKDLYGDPQAASSALQEEIKVPQSARLGEPRITEKAIVVKAVVAQQQEVVQTIAMLSLGVYRILNFARHAGAGGP